LRTARALVLYLTAIGDTRDDGFIEVFFELNGQPARDRGADRAASSSIKARRKADDANRAHVAAPMPGSISLISVKPGQTGKDWRRYS